MKNAFYFILKSLLILKILFGHVKKWFDWKYQVNFEIYDVTTWLTDNCNTHIPNTSREKDLLNISE